MNQGKWNVVKEEMARMNIDILGISELKETGMGELSSVDHCIYYFGHDTFRRKGVALIINKRLNRVLWCILKNDRMISVHFQSKQFSITVIQVYAPTKDAKEAEADQFYEDLQDLLTPHTHTHTHTHTQNVLFIIGDWNAKVGR